MAPVATSIVNAATPTPVRPDTEAVHDVTIIGAGPAGAMLASCLSRLGVKPLVFDVDPNVHEWGRGDALMPRTVEVLSQMGNAHPGTSVGEALLSRATLINGLAGYGGDGTALQPGLRQPMLQLLDVDQQCIYGVRQGVVEQTLLNDAVAVQVEDKSIIFRPYKFVGLKHTAGDASAPIGVEVVDVQGGQSYIVKTRFLVGADGGKSTMRKALAPYGISFDGSNPEAVWCAMDFVGAATTFPDTRVYSLIDGGAKGKLMLIPREPIDGHECFRLYIQVDQTSLTRETVKQKDAIKAAQSILQPYTLSSWHAINWFTAYPVGQRLASAFSVNQRIFLMGDACHTHSPKGGLGMNTSMMDAYNLSWKLALVLKQHAKHDIISTYNDERRSVAEKLLAYDTALLKLFQQAKDDVELAKEFAQLEKRNALYHMGVGIVYAPTLLVSQHADPRLSAAGPYSRILTGSRILPATVRRFRDLRLVSFLNELCFDLRFRIVVLAGDLTRSQNKAALQHLSNALSHPTSFVTRYNNVVDTNTYDTFQQASIKRQASLIDFKTVTTTNSCDPRLNSERFPALAAIKQQPVSLLNDDALYCDEVPALSGFDYLMYKQKWFPPDDGEPPLPPPLEILPFQLHQRYDVDPVNGGALIVVRPDGHIAVATTFDVDTLSRESVVETLRPVQEYFDAFMLTK